MIGETQDSAARSGKMVQVKSSSTLDLQKDGQTPKQLNTDDSDKALHRPFLNNVSQSTYYEGEGSHQENTLYGTAPSHQLENQAALLEQLNHRISVSKQSD